MWGEESELSHRALPGGTEKYLWWPGTMWNKAESAVLSTRFVLVKLSYNLNSIYLSIQYGSQSDAFPLDQNKLSAIHFWTNSRFVVPEGDKAKALTNLS